MKNNRWLVLFASVVMNLCIGSAYAWSVFQKPLMETFGWTTSQASLAFTINLSLVPIAMIFAGKVQDKKGPKYVTLAGGAVFGIGMYLTGKISTITGLYLSYGLLGGVGIGMIYACTVGNTMKWFPDKRGLAGGLIAAGFGMGSVILAPIAVKMISTIGVSSSFNYVGIFYGCGVILASFVIKAPVVGWKPNNWEPVRANGSTVEDYEPKEMMKSPLFFLVWILYTIGCVGGLMIIGHASPIGQEKIGLSPELAAMAISFLGIANSSGRIFWGTISDRIGRYNTLIMMFVTSAVCLMILNVASTYLVFVVGVCGIAMSFGGYLGIMPSVTADNFGSKNIGINYGILFTAYGLAAFIGPRLAAVIKQANHGEYQMAFMIVALMNIVGVVLTFVLKKHLKKENNVLVEEM